MERVVIYRGEGGIGPAAFPVSAAAARIIRPLLGVDGGRAASRIRG